MSYLDDSHNKEEKEKEKTLILNVIISARKLISERFYDIFIFDELLTALNLGMIEEYTLIELFNIKPEQIELILTGLKPTQKIIDIADLVTEMRMIKHPYQSGLKARKGIEY